MSLDPERGQACRPFFGKLAGGGVDENVTPDPGIRLSSDGLAGFDARGKGFPHSLGLPRARACLDRV